MSYQIIHGVLSRHKHVQVNVWHGPRCAGTKSKLEVQTRCLMPWLHV